MLQEGKLTDIVGVPTPKVPVLPAWNIHRHRFVCPFVHLHGVWVKQASCCTSYWDIEWKASFMNFGGDCLIDIAALTCIVENSRTSCSSRCSSLGLGRPSQGKRLKAQNQIGTLFLWMSLDCGCWSSKGATNLRYAAGGIHQIDLAIVGADEVDPDLNLVKGRGGALLREKVNPLLACFSNLLRLFLVCSSRSY